MARVSWLLWILVIYLLSDRIAGKSCSSEALGLESGAIFDEQLKASSEQDQYHAPKRSRLNTEKAVPYYGGWAPPLNPPEARVNSWIQADLLLPTIVTHIGTQGRASYDEWVTKYSVQFQSDGGNMVDFANGTVFNGNNDRSTAVINHLETPIITRIIRIVVKDFRTHVGMRWEIYGCVAEFRCKVKALGMRDGSISDARISASTILSSNDGAERSRLGTTVNGPLAGAWTPASNDLDPWIQVNLTRLTKITRIDTQGRAGVAQWVKTYTLKLCLYNDGISPFIDYEKGKNFTANTDHITTVSNDLDPPIVAVFIRLYPKSFEVAASMRWELYGCVPEPCDDPLGMQTGMILDSKITASSTFSSNTSASRARLGLMMHGSLAGGWRAAESDISSWIQIDLSSDTTVTRIAIQGRSDLPQWVKTYTLQYGKLESKLYDYDTVFNANSDQNTVVSSILDPPILARYVRLLPKTYHGAVALRMELYGCLQEFCDHALGMQSRAIPNERITASSSYSSRYKPYLARLGTRQHGLLYGAWAPVAQGMDTDSWIQVDLGRQITISKIATQGRPDFDQWVKTYSLQHGTMGVYLMEYRNSSNAAVFNGNSDRNTIVYNVLDPPIFARYIRILPKSYNVFVSMRFELYGGCNHLECKDYTRLSSSDRLKTEPLSGAAKCDMDKIGWYRFVDDAGTQIATTCMPKRRCQADSGGWMNGTHPSTSDGSVRRTVCFSDTDCCSFSTSIYVRNCGPYFVYKFNQSHHCDLRYCSEKVSVSFATEEILDEEHKAQANIPVERSTNFPYLPFNLSISNGTALSTVDFKDIISPLLVTFSPGQSTVNIKVPVVEDDIYESGDETFSAQLLGSFANVKVDTVTNKTVTIEEDDNECYVYNNFSATDRFEDDTTVGPAKCDNIAEGWYRIVGPSGTELATSCPSLNKCGANTTMWMETKHPLEKDRRVLRKICYNENGQCCNRSHNIYVRNCGTFYVYKLLSPLVCARYCTSKLEVSWTETSKDVNETVGKFTLRLTRSGNDLGKLTTNIKVSTPTGPSLNTAYPMSDFLPVDLEVTLKSAGAYDDVVLSVIDDDITESTEMFTVALSTPDGATVTNGMATINIIDNDKVNVSLEFSSYSVYEDVGYVEIEVFCIGAREVPIKYSLTTFNGNAIGAVNYSTNPFGDYIHLPGIEKEFTAMETIQSFRILLNNDSMLEDNETFLVTLESLVPQLTVIKPYASATVTIKDEDWVFVEFLKPFFDVNEDVDTDFLQVIMNGTTEVDVNLRISSLNHSAYSKHDYVAVSNQLLTFAPTYTSPTIMNVAVNITDEVLIERDEHLKMVLTTSQKTVRLGRNLTEIHILNNDKAIIGFTTSSLAVSENGGKVSLCMYKRGLAAIPLTVTLDTVNGTAKANVDYEIISNRTIRFLPSQSLECTDVTIKNDNVTEYDEVFYIMMTTKDPAVIVQDDRNNLTLTILNDDKVTLEFEEVYKLTVEESFKEGKIDLVCAITEGVTAIPVQVNFTENPNKMKVTADPGADFVLRNNTLTFHPGTTRHNLTIFIIPDGDVETNEIFAVKIESPDETHAVAGGRQHAFVKIKDDRDFAKSVAQKLEQERKGEYKRMVFKLCIAAICLLAIITLLGILLLVSSIKSKFR